MLCAAGHVGRRRAPRGSGCRSCPRSLRQRAILVVRARRIRLARRRVDRRRLLGDADVEDAVRRQLTRAAGVIVRQPACSPPRAASCWSSAPSTAPASGSTGSRNSWSRLPATCVASLPRRSSSRRACGTAVGLDLAAATPSQRSLVLMAELTRDVFGVTCAVARPMNISRPCVCRAVTLSSLHTSPSRVQVEGVRVGDDAFDGGLGVRACDSCQRTTGGRA